MTKIQRPKKIPWQKKQLISHNITDHIDIFIELFDIHVSSRTARRIFGSCPVHHGDNDSAFNICIDKNSNQYGLWYCNTRECHHENRNAFGLIKLLLENNLAREVNDEEVLNFVNQHTGINESEIDETLSSSNYEDLVLNRILNSLYRNPTTIPVTNTKKQIKKEDILKNKHYICPSPFYLSRGFTKESLMRFAVGDCMNEEKELYGRTIFPIFDQDGIYIGCHTRSIYGQKPRWKMVFPSGVKGSDLLYGYYEAVPEIMRTSSVILVEGCGDVLRLYEAGVYNSVAIFGSHISQNQLMLIHKLSPETVVLLFDNDEAGEKCKKNTYDKLSLLYNVKIPSYEGKDVGDLSVDYIKDVLVKQF